MSINRNKVENRVSINQNALNETTITETVKEVLEKIEHENDLYENYEINRSNPSVLLSNKQKYLDMFSVDFLSASMISFKRFT